MVKKLEQENVENQQVKYFLFSVLTPEIIPDMFCKMMTIPASDRQHEQEFYDPETRILSHSGPLLMDMIHYTSACINLASGYKTVGH